MKIFNSTLLIVVFWLTVSYSFAQPCTSGCTITVSTTTSTNYTVTTGQLLCVTPSGVINGNVTLNGGTICNRGIIQAPVFTVNSGTINNYGSILQVGDFELKTTSVFNNYNNALLKVSQKFLVHPTALYLSESAGQLLVYPFSIIPIIPAANPPYAKLGASLDGGCYLASDGFLYFQYDEEYTGGTLKYKIYNNSHSVIMSNTLDPLPSKVYGDNRFQLKVACKMGLGDYVLEVTNDKNETSTLRFNVTTVFTCP